jgi:hypothetical protein
MPGQEVNKRQARHFASARAVVRKRHAIGRKIERSLAVDKIIFDDLNSGRIMCLTFMGGQLWLCYKHQDGQFVTERKATIDDISKICQAPSIKVAAECVPSRDKPASLADNASLTTRRVAAGVPPTDNTSQLEMSGPCILVQNICRYCKKLCACKECISENPAPPHQA